MIPNQREYEIFGMGQTRIYIYMLLYYHCFIYSVPVIFPKCKLNSAKKKKKKKKKNLQKWYYIGLLRLKGGFTVLSCLSDSHIIPLQIPIALY